ncbi:hypothetical protein Tco_0445880 [Tanacetum coccineum]
MNALLDSLPRKNVEIKNSNVSDEPVLLNTPLSDKVAQEDNNDEINAFLAMEVSTNFEEGYFDSEGDLSSLSVSPIPVEDSEPTQEEIDIFLVPDDLLPPGVENDDSEEEVRIYQKSQENHQKQASTDTRRKSAQKPGSKAKEKSSTSQWQGHNRLIKALISSLKLDGHVGRQGSTNEDWFYTTSSHISSTKVSHQGLPARHPFCEFTCDPRLILMTKINGMKGVDC